MAGRVIVVDGARWSVAPTGRITQYTKDEFTVEFTRLEPGPREVRVARYSPLGSKDRESSLAELGDAELIALFRVSQPSWTTPETGYRR
jgi:hypothetical protein